nr:HutD family protein [Limimaricola sp.]
MMPWANGRGQTLELVRVAGQDGLLWRLSVAQVVEDCAFSPLPGIARSLTVISGPGFDLAGDVALRADPLVPVAFAGGATVRAVAVTAPSEDFNVMTAGHLPKPQVNVLRGDVANPPIGGIVAVFAMEDAAADGQTLAARHLLLSDAPLTLAGGTVIAVALAVPLP